MGAQGIGMPVEVATATAPRPPSAATPAAPPDAAAPQRRGGRTGVTAFLPAFLPSVAGGLALLLHNTLPNRQPFADATHIYPRLLTIVIAAGVVLGLTQRLWRPMKLSLLRFPAAAPLNVLHWCVANAPILAAGIILTCAWD